MKHTLPAFFLSLSIVFLLQACSSTRNVSIPVSVPPVVYLPDHIQSIGIVNRSLAQEGDKTLNVLESIFSGEGLGEDKQGSMACVNGVETQLNEDGLVYARLMDSVMLSSKGTGVMPQPLDWEQVEEICGEKGFDALLVLEVFDTDQGSSNTSNTVNQIFNVARSGQVNPNAIPGNNNTRVLVKAGWRLYDFQKKVILDEVRMSDWFNVNSRNTLFDLGEWAKRDAIQQSGYMAGRTYPSRFRSSWVNIWRPYYIRKGSEMKKADRLVRVNRFDKAAEIWLSLADHHKRKIAGRACYNLAINAEINNDLEGALEWAERAFAEFREPRADDYVRNLRRRINSGR